MKSAEFDIKGIFGRFGIGRRAQVEQVLEAPKVQEVPVVEKKPTLDLLKFSGEIDRIKRTIHPTLFTHNGSSIETREAMIPGVSHVLIEDTFVNGKNYTTIQLTDETNGDRKIVRYECGNDPQNPLRRFEIGERTVPTKVYVKYSGGTYMSDIPEIYKVYKEVTQDEADALTAGLSMAIQYKK